MCFSAAAVPNCRIISVIWQYPLMNISEANEMRKQLFSRNQIDLAPFQRRSSAEMDTFYASLRKKIGTDKRK